MPLSSLFCLCYYIDGLIYWLHGLWSWCLQVAKNVSHQFPSLLVSIHCSPHGIEFTQLSMDVSCLTHRTWQCCLKLSSLVHNVVCSLGSFKGLLLRRFLSGPSSDSVRSSQRCFDNQSLLGSQLRTMWAIHIGQLRPVCPPDDERLLSWVQSAYESMSNNKTVLR